MPWVHGVIIKESLGMFSANSIVPAAAQRKIQAEAERAIKNAAHAKPYTFEPPITLEVQLATVEQADLVATIPSFERIGSRRIRFTHDDYPTIFKAFVATWRLGRRA
jgi:D-amino peptidase